LFFYRDCYLIDELIEPLWLSGFDYNLSFPPETDDAFDFSSSVYDLFFRPMFRDFFSLLENVEEWDWVNLSPVSGGVDARPAGKNSWYLL